MYPKRRDRPWVLLGMEDLKILVTELSIVCVYKPRNSDGSMAD